MNKIQLLTITTVVGLILIGIGSSSLTYFFINQKLLKHDTDRWAIIKDTESNRLAIETSNDTVWDQLVNLFNNGTSMFIGGIVENYDNKWGFRFKPGNLTISQVTAEGLQATIQYISDNLDYWLDSWAYVSSFVISIKIL